MGIKLDPRYQEEGYREVKRTLKETKRAGIILPPGAGKSYIALKWIEDSLEENGQILYVSPSPTINARIRKIIRQNYDKETAQRILSKVEFTTYHALHRRYKDNKQDMREYNSSKMILDEVHRSGAPEWGEAVDYLLETNKEAEILGMTATPLRNDGQDMIEKRCGKPAYTLEISEAVARGILKLPIYISARHIFKEDIESLEEKIELIEDEKQKKELEERLRKVKKQIENAKGLKEIYEKHLEKNGKYLMFCNPGDDIEQLQEQAKQEGVFEGVNPKQTYLRVESSRTERENIAALNLFERRGNDGLKLLYSKNMLIEGIHDEEITGEIMQRPTKSYRLFVQTLGRVLSRNRKTTPVVLDLVGNIKYFKEFRLEIQNIIKEGIKRGNRIYDPKVLENFKIIEEQENLIEAFEKIEERSNKYLGKGKFLKNALKIEEWCKKTFEGKKEWERRLPSQLAKEAYEKELGIKLSPIRQNVLKQYEGKELEEIKDEEDRRIVEIIRRLDKEYGMKTLLKNALEIEEWCKSTFEGKREWERRLPSQLAKEAYEKQLGQKLVNIRYYKLKQYEGKELEEIKDEEDRRIVEIIRRLDKEYGMKTLLKNALEIEEWCKSTFEGKREWERRLPSQLAKEAYEKQLGQKLVNIRCYKLKQYEDKELKEIEDEEDRRIVETIRKLDKKYGMKAYLKNALEIEEWCKGTFEGKREWERRLPNSKAKEAYEKQLGQKLVGIRSCILKQYEGKELKEIEDEEDRRIVETIRRLDKEYGMKTLLKNALEIEEWCKSTFEGKREWERRLPSQLAKEAYEKQLGQKLVNIRCYKLKQYEDKELKEIEDEEDRRIVEIIRGLDKEYKISLKDKRNMKKNAEMKNKAAKILCNEYEAELKEQDKEGEDK